MSYERVHSRKTLDLCTSSLDHHTWRHGNLADILHGSRATKQTYYSTHRAKPIQGGERLAMRADSLHKAAALIW